MKILKGKIIGVLTTRLGVSYNAYLMTEEES